MTDIPLAREIDAFVAEWKASLATDIVGRVHLRSTGGIALLERASEQIDMLEMTATEGREILTELVAEIEAVTPPPAEMPCDCLHCRHHKGVERLIALARERTPA